MYTGEESSLWRAASYPRVMRISLCDKRSWTFSIGTPLASSVVATVRRPGTSLYDAIGLQDMTTDSRYFERGMGAQEGLARVNQTLRQRVEFRQLNLLEIGSLDRTFGVIFCRNVMIYFDRQVQQRVVSMLERHLRPGGYLFISHSESLNGVTHGLRWVAPAIYQRRTS